MPFLTDEPKAKIKRDFPRFRPENQVPLYLECLEQKNTVKRQPKWDAPPENISLEVAKAHAKLKQAETKLKEIRAGEKEKRKVLEQQWADLGRKEEEFKDAFIKYNEFLRENAEKRVRCRIKMQMDSAVIENREKQMEALQKEYDAMFAVKRRMEDVIKKHQVYEDYLRAVVEASSDFEHPIDVLKRYDVLMQARELTLNRQEQSIKLLENAQADMNHLINTKTESIRVFSNRISLMLSRYETAMKKSLYWEKIIENIRQHMCKSALDISGVKSAAWSLYQKMCQRKGEEPKFKEGDVENHLLYIKRTLRSMESIATRATTIEVKPKKKAKVLVVKQDGESVRLRAVWNENSINSPDSSGRSAVSFATLQ